MGEMNDDALEEALLRQWRPGKVGTLKEAREQMEGLLLSGLVKGGLSHAEARIEAMNVVARFERMAAGRGLEDLMEPLALESVTPEACRTTRHCADHGWCRRCDPAFAAVMSRINEILQTTSLDSPTWAGWMYARIAEMLHGRAGAGLAVQLADSERDRQRLTAELEELKHRLAGLEK